MRVRVLVCELRRATHLSLSATKETARSIGRSMAALVATERHLWLNLSNIKGKDKHFLMDAPLSSSGLFGDAVNLVVERFQESAKQVAAFQKLLPRRIHIYRKGYQIPTEVAPQQILVMEQEVKALLEKKGHRICTSLQQGNRVL